MLSQVLLALGISLIIIGFLLVILAVLLAGTKSGSTRTSAGGIILIGPFPIVFGSKDLVKIMLALAIAMIAVLIIVNIVLFTMTP